MIYTKSYYASTSSTGTATGTYMYTFNSTDFNFDKAAERRVSTETLSSMTIVDENSLLTANGTLTYYTYVADKDVYNKDVFSTEYGKIENATVVGVNDGYAYLIVSNLFKRIKLDKTENIQTFGADKVHVKFINPEIVVDGSNAYIYYFNDSKSKYLYRIDINSFSKATQEVDNILFGIKTQADIDAEKKAEEKK